MDAGVKNSEMFSARKFIAPTNQPVNPQVKEYRHNRQKRPQTIPLAMKRTATTWIIMPWSLQHNLFATVLVKWSGMLWFLTAYDWHIILSHSIPKNLHDTDEVQNILTYTPVALQDVEYIICKACAEENKLKSPQRRRSKPF